ncbi:hypothetical protein ACNKHO_08760 [Shigella flexneri]
MGLAKRIDSRLKNSYPRELVRDGKLFGTQVVAHKKSALFFWHNLRVVYAEIGTANW